MKFFSTLVASTLGVLIASGIMLFLFILFLVAITATSAEKPTVARNSVLALDLSGPIPERGAADPIVGAISSTPSFGLFDVVRSIELAGVDERITALWIRAAGPSVPFASLQEIRVALEKFKESGKPIIASANGLAVGEAAYYLMSVADSIYALPGAPFEFNGFYINAEFYKRSMEKLNVDPQIIRAGKYKSAVEPFIRTDLSAENEVQLQRIIDEQQERFASAISIARGSTIEEVLGLLKSTEIMMSEDALRAGLIDGLAYGNKVEDVVRKAAGTADGADLALARIESYSSLTPRDVGVAANTRNEVAVLYAEGTITSGRSQEGSSVGSASFKRTVETVLNRDAVKAVVLRINSPGGSATASDEMLNDLRELADKKPIVVSMGSVAASGGYWIAMAADTIVADPLTITGSIGVYSMFFDVGGLFDDKLGINFDVVRTGPNSDMLSGFRELTSTERDALARSVDITYANFLELVAENRSMTPDEVNELAQGRVWTGSDALRVGLIDLLGGLDESIDIAARMAGLEEGDYSVAAYPRPASFWEQLNDRMENSIRALPLSVTALPEISAFERQAVSRIRQIEELLRDAATVQARMPLTITVH